jgi:HSP20 family protein
MSKLVRRENLFDDFFRDFPFGYQIAPLHGDPLPQPGRITIDVKENNGKLIVQAEVPGVKKEDIDVTVDRNVVTISARVEQYDADTENDNILHSERYYGEVRRSITLPSDAASDEAVAKYEDGILTLTIPKADANATKKVAVN